LFVDQGFGKALIQRRELRSEHVDTAFWTSVSLAAVLVASVLFAAPFIEQGMRAPGLAGVLRWMSLAIALQALAGTPAALLEREFDFRTLALRRISSTLLGGIAGVSVALAGGGVYALVVQSLTAACAGLVALWAATPYRPRLRLERAALRELWPVGAGVLGIELIGLVNAEADRFLVGSFLSTAALGFYFLAMRITQVIVELFSTVFASLCLPMFSRLQDDPARMRSWLYRLTGASSAVTLPCLALVAIAAPVALPAVFGAKWSGSVPLLQVLTVLGAINAVAYFDRNVLIAAGRSRLALLLTLGQALLGVVLIFGVVSYGVLAVAIAVVARQYLFWPVRLAVLRRVLGVDLGTYFTQWFGPFLAACAMLPLLLVVPSFRAFRLELQLVLVAGVSCAALVLYCVALRLIRPRILNELRTAFSEFKAHRRSAKAA
jgi:PST family polysaccharide transporter